MTLSPTVITGLVGVAGIAATLLAARMTARSQTADLMLSIGEEKKSASLRTNGKACLYMGAMRA